MPLIVACPKCKARYKLPTGSAGKRGRCDRCKTVFRIPEPDAQASPPPEPLNPAPVSEPQSRPSPASYARPAPAPTATDALWRFKEAMADAREALDRGAYPKAGELARKARMTKGFETVAEARWFWLELCRHLPRVKPVGLMDLGEPSLGGDSDKGRVTHLALSRDGAVAALVRAGDSGATLTLWDLDRDKGLGPELNVIKVNGLTAGAAGARFAVSVERVIEMPAKARAEAPAETPEDAQTGIPGDMAVGPETQTMDEPLAETPAKSGESNEFEPDDCAGPEAAEPGVEHAILILDAAAHESTGAVTARFRTKGPELPLWLDSTGDRLLTRSLESDDNQDSPSAAPRLWDLSSREMLVECGECASPALMTPDECDVICMRPRNGQWQVLRRAVSERSEDQVLAGHAAEPVALSLSLDGTRCMSADQGGQIRVCDLAEGGETRSMAVDEVSAAWITPCGGHVLALCKDHLIFLDAATGEKGPRIKLPSIARQAGLSLDSRFLLWVGEDGKLRHAGLDWDLDLTPRLWEDAVQPLCDLFFLKHSPREARLDPKPCSGPEPPLLEYAPRPPHAYPSRELALKALRREGLPWWEESHVDEFLALLGCAGLAAMTPEALAEHLDGLLQHTLMETRQGFAPPSLDLPDDSDKEEREPASQAAPWLPDQDQVPEIACAAEAGSESVAEPEPAFDPEATRLAAPESPPEITPEPGIAPDFDPEATRLSPEVPVVEELKVEIEAAPVSPGADETRLAEAAQAGADELQVISAEPASRQASPTPAVPASAAFAGLTPGEVFLERYEVLELLGEGGFGTVHRVRHLDWNLDLAVKSPRPEALAAAGGVENFHREAETWVNLGLHPHVTSCFYVRDMDGVPRVFAECVPGGSLKDWIREGRLKSAAEILDVAIQFAWGLAYAHAQGLVHQDVKPANVLMTNEGAPKVTDFGLAVAKSGDQGSAQAYTPAYAAPEQVEAGPVSQRTDIWSFGLSILEMFLGEVTWAVGTVAAEVLEALVQDEQAHMAVELPPRVARLLAWCFKLAPELRPQSMAEVVDSLKEAYAEAAGSPYMRAEPRAARDSADSLNNRAVSLLDLGRKDDAVGLLVKAMNEQPHHPESTYNLNLLKWRQGEVSDLEVVEALRVAAGSHEGDWAVACLAAQVHLERGDPEAAEQALEALPPEVSAQGEVRSVREALERTRKGLGRKQQRLVLTRGNAGLSVLHEHGRFLLAALGTGGRFVLVDTLESRIIQEFSGHPLLPSRPGPGRSPGRGNVTSLAMTSDLQWALSGGGDGTIRLWDMGSGKLMRVLPGHEGAVTCISLSSDGNLALTGGADGAARLWDMHKGRALRATLFQHIGPVTAVQLGADSELAFSAGEDGTVVQWDAATGRKLSLVADLEQPVTSLFLSREGDALATGDAAGGVALWEPLHGELILQVEPPDAPGPGRGVANLSLTLDGRFLLITDTQGMRLRESPSGRLLSTFARRSAAESRRRRAGHVHSDGSWCSVVTCQGDEVLMHDFSLQPAPMALARVRASEEVSLAQGEYEKWLEKARDASMRGDMAAVARCVREGRALQGFARHREAMSLWTGLYLRLPRKGLGGAWEAGASEPFPGPANTLRLTPGGKHVLAAGEEEWRLWDAFTLETVFSAPHLDAPRCLECAPDADLALSGGESTLALWETATGERLSIMEDDSFSGAACLGPGGRFALSGCRDGSVRVWEPQSGALLATLRDSRGKGQAVTVLAASSDGRFAVSGDAFGVFRVWDLAASVCRKRFSNYTSPATAVSLSRDNRYLLAGVRQGLPVLYRLATGRVLRTFAQPRGAEAVCLGPGGQFAVTAGPAGLFIWDVGVREPLRVYEEGAGGVFDAALSPEGGHVVTRGADNRLRLWMLDWELEVRDSGAWDEAALPLMISFCTRRTPYARQDSPGPEPRRADTEAFLTRKGRPVWSEKDFEELLRELGAAGYGWIDAESVRERLAELGEEWQEPPRKLHPEEPGLDADPGGWTEHPGRWERFDMAMDRSRALLLTGNDQESMQALAEARALPGFERNAEALNQWALFYKAFPTQELRQGFASRSGALPAFPAPLSGLALHQTSGGVLVGLGPGGPGNERLVSFNWSWGRRGPAWQIRRLALDWTEPVAALDVNEQGLALVADVHGRLVLWDMVRDAFVCELDCPVREVREVRLAPEGRLCLVVGPKEVLVMDAAKGRVLRSAEGQAADPSSDWTRVFLGRERSVALWDLAADKDLAVMDRAGVSKTVRLCLGNRWALSGSDRGKIKLWNLEQRSCVATWDGHKGGVAALLVSPDGRTAMSGGRDGEIKAWDLERREEIPMEAWHQGPVTALAFTPQRTHLVSAGQDHMIRLWALDWEITPQGREDQDRVEAAMVEDFLRRHTPWAKDLGKEPSEQEIQEALTRQGKPRWSEADAENLRESMRRAGLGPQDEERLRGLVEQASGDKRS